MRKSNITQSYKPILSDTQKLGVIELVLIGKKFGINIVEVEADIERKEIFGKVKIKKWKI